MSQKGINFISSLLSGHTTVSASAFQPSMSNQQRNSNLLLSFLKELRINVTFLWVWIKYFRQYTIGNVAYIKFVQSKPNI